MKKIIVLISCIFYSHFLSSQNATNVVRYDLQNNENIEYSGFFAIGTKGIIIRTTDKNKNPRGADLRVRTYEILDTNFQKKKSFDFKTEHKYRKEFQAHTHNTFNEISFDKDCKFKLHSINLTTFKQNTFVGSLPEKTKVFIVEALDDYLFIRAAHDGNLLFLLVNTNTGEQKQFKFPPKSSKSFLFLNVEKDTISNKIHVFYFDKIDEKNILKFLVFADGELKNDYNIPFIENRYPYSGSAKSLSDGSYLITGTYVTKLLYDANVDSYEGFYISKIKENKVVMHRFINYNNLKNFTNILYINDSIYEKSKAVLRHSYKIVNPHFLINNSNSFIFIGEVMFPAYEDVREVSNSGQIYYKTAMTGYKMSLFFIFEFDANGKEIWSNCFPMDIGYNTYKFYQQYLMKNIKNNIISTAFLQDYNVIYSIIDKGNIIKCDTISDSFSKQNKNLIVETKNEIKNWYEHTFITYGYQLVMDKSNKKNKILHFTKYTIKP